MEQVMLIILCLSGLLSLVAGGELLTLSASKLAKSLGVRQIIIGLTVVAFGTSMPEAFVSIFAALGHQSEIAVANVIGSNIFNITFILGVAAIIKPLKVEVSSLKREVPFVVGAAGLVWALSYDRVLSRVDGIIFLTIFVVFFATCFLSVLRNKEGAVKPTRQSANKYLLALKIIGSLVLLVLGAKLLVSGASGIARLFGVSELLIGLTIVAAGTSLPEFASSALAAYRGKDDIAVGNVTGSNIFNILFILGMSALFYPLTVSDTVLFRDIPVMVATSLVAIPILKSGFVISRIEGVFLVVFYIGYVLSLILAG